jgi:uncharacterized membrane protein YhaH (DUF805 family)
MNFPDAIISCFRQYVTFSGRAPRSEFWYWVLFYLLLSIVVVELDAQFFHAVAVTTANPPMVRGASMHLQDNGPLARILSVLLFLPNLSVSARRLHDVNRSAWWLLLLLIPLIGWLPLLIWYCSKSDVGDNRFGPSPLA